VEGGHIFFTRAFPRSKKRVVISSILRSVANVWTKGAERLSSDSAAPLVSVSNKKCGRTCPAGAWNEGPIRGGAARTLDRKIVARGAGRNNCDIPRCVLDVSHTPSSVSTHDFSVCKLFGLRGFLLLRDGVQWRLHGRRMPPPSFLLSFLHSVE
jgi:hypothetical protein